MSGFWYMGAVTLCMMAGGSAVVLNKCCDDGSGMGENGTCVPQEVPPLVLPQVFAAPGVVAPSPPPPQFVHHRPPCSFLVLLSDKIDGPLYLLEDGRLEVTAHSVTFDTSQYCIVNSGGVAGFLACPDSEDIGDPEIEKAMIYPVGMVASLLLLVITFFVYSMLPELRNLQGKTTLCLVGCLSWTYLSLVIVQLGTNSLSLTACSVFAYTIQFFFLAVFFWLNVMCFDIYWAFSGIRNLKGSAKERELKKFLLYALYAWGCPLILLVFTLIMDYSSILPASSPYKPDMGLKNCFFETSEATWLYFYGPMTVLIFANLVMFAITARRIFVHRRETSVLKSGDSKRHNNDKERFNLYLKLFVVMGINWVMELVSWVVKGPQQIWYLTDITNTLQGVFIFVIFVCKRRIFRLINQKLCPGKKLWPGHSTKSSHGASTTSHATGSTVASSGSGKKQGVSTINMEPMSEDSVRLNAEDSDGQM